jgi:hypothetical protein
MRISYTSPWPDQVSHTHTLHSLFIVSWESGYTSKNRETRKRALVTYSKVAQCPGIRQVTEESQEKSVTTVGNPAKIQTGHLPNASRFLVLCTWNGGATNCDITAVKWLTAQQKLRTSINASQFYSGEIRVWISAGAPTIRQDVFGDFLQFLSSPLHFTAQASSHSFDAK